MDRTESDSPRRELSNGGLESVVTLLVRWQINYVFVCVSRKSNPAVCGRRWWCEKGREDTESKQGSILFSAHDDLGTFHLWNVDHRESLGLVEAWHVDWRPQRWRKDQSKELQDSATGRDDQVCTKEAKIHLRPGHTKGVRQASSKQQGQKKLRRSRNIGMWPGRMRAPGRDDREAEDISSREQDVQKIWESRRDSPV